MTVASADQSAEFFTRVLDFTKASDRVVREANARRVRMELGAECVELDEPIAGIRRPMPADSRNNDLWFQHVAIVVRDLDRAFARLEANHVRGASVAPQRLPAWNPNAGGIGAYYFKDPDGHTLEILSFPPDKGAARWHARGDALFLGIDHTAIATSSTDASVAFYEARGLRVAGRSENWGPEQEALNAVAGAHLRITTLRAPSGPGIELLEYLAPRTGRPVPDDVRADDVMRWRTVLFANDAAPHTEQDPDKHVLEIQR
jgi:catechol 2,3-dioxygenase-like lactoylglutathione lyase family enzyme